MTASLEQLAPTAWANVCAALAIARRDCAESGDSDEEIALYGGAQAAASSALLLTPAPDAAALAYKLQVFLEEEAFNLWNDAVRKILGVMIADAQRLQTGRRPGDRP